MFFEHWSHVPSYYWRWRFFKPEELASKGNGSLLVDEDALDLLEDARRIAGKPFYINSAYRDEYHNALIGGSPRSLHVEGRAFDISLRNHDKQYLITVLEQAGFTGLGISYSTFIHADNGRKRRW